MKKVLYIYNHIGVAGAEKITADIISLLDKDKIKPTVFVDKDNTGSQYQVIIDILDNAGCDIIYRSRKFAGAPESALPRFFAEYDVIHYNYWGNYELFTTILEAQQLNPSLKTILVIHTSETDIPLGKHIFDITISCYPNEEYNNKNGIVFIPNGVKALPNTLSKESICKQFKLNFRVPYIVSVGHVDSNKNYIEVVESMGRLRERGVPMGYYLIVGETSFEWSTTPYTELTRRIRELGLRDRVVFTGPLSSVHSILAHSRACIHPSHKEAFSVAMLEYMQHGKPVVINERLINSVYNNSNCVIYKSIQELDTILTSIFSSESSYQEMKKNALATAQKYSLSTTAELLTKIYIGENIQ